MNDQLLLVGEDAFYTSRELHHTNTIHVATTDEAMSLISRFDFEAIVATDGEVILKDLRARGKHTPMLNISHTESQVDCCGGHMRPEATLSEKANALSKLMARNHHTDC